MNQLLTSSGHCELKIPLDFGQNHIFKRFRQLQVIHLGDLGNAVFWEGEIFYKVISGFLREPV